MKKVMIFFLLMLVSSSAYSQLQQVAIPDSDEIYINGLQMYGCYTHEEVIEAWGKPDEYVPDVEEGFRDYTYYGKGEEYAEFSFLDYIDYLMFATIKSPEFTINGIFTVGDNINKIPASWKYRHYPDEDGSGHLSWAPPKWVEGGEEIAFITVYYDERGMITRMEIGSY